jgi:Ca-activated chloride channel family protein
VVLLTDGRANAGAVPIDVATALAAAEGIRVHAVGIGTGGEVAIAGSAGARRVRVERHDLDLDALRSVATATGGRSFAARTSGDLADVYAEIDTLERVERPAPPRGGGQHAPEPFLAAAGLLLLVEIAAARVFGRRLP